LGCVLSRDVRIGYANGSGICRVDHAVFVEKPLLGSTEEDVNVVEYQVKHPCPLRQFDRVCDGILRKDFHEPFDRCNSYASPGIAQSIQNSRTRAPDFEKEAEHRGK
jgi:hypothetical protein